MKKMLLFFVLLLVNLTSFSQQQPATDIKLMRTPETATNQQPKPIKLEPDIDYLHRSQSQKTFAWILAGVGTVIVAGTLINSNTHKSSSNSDGSWFNFNDLDHDFNTYAYLTGGAIMVGSIYLFVAAHNNKLKAAGTVGLMQLNNVPQWNCSSGKPTIVPSAGISISF